MTQKQHHVTEIYQSNFFAVLLYLLDVVQLNSTSWQLALFIWLCRDFLTFVYNKVAVCLSAEEYSYHIISTSGQLGHESLIQNKVRVESGRVLKMWPMSHSGLHCVGWGVKLYSLTYTHLRRNELASWGEQLRTNHSVPDWRIANAEGFRRQRCATYCLSTGWSRGQSRLCFSSSS